MRTRITELLGIQHPILCAPMGPDLTGPELVAAVGNAGGLGFLQAQLAPPDTFRAEIRRTRNLSDAPFGVSLLLQFPVEDQVNVCLEERVNVIWFFWGDPAPFIQSAHDAGVLVAHQVGSIDAARQAAEAGVDLIIAQGVEAGGHVAGSVSTMVLVPQVVDAVTPIPVAAAGGIADARGVAAVLALGAQAAVLGTRFLATAESRAHPEYKQQLINAASDDTVLTQLFGHGWPYATHRTLRTAFVEEWLGNEARGQESRANEPVVGHTRISGQDVAVPRFAGFPPNADSRGDIALRNLLAGQSVGMIGTVPSAATLVCELAEGARQILREH
jgi:NAD(P)H-dependent flavin oxidoreductase YrpB (nitropropane dioxygenase family)